LLFNWETKSYYDPLIPQVRPQFSAIVQEAPNHINAGPTGKGDRKQTVKRGAKLAAFETGMLD
jgi:hypothetical protein